MERIRGKQTLKEETFNFTKEGYAVKPLASVLFSQLVYCNYYANHGKDML